MIQISDAANKIRDELFNIWYNISEKTSNPIPNGKTFIFLIDKNIIKNSLDRIQNLCNVCETTPNTEFNKLVHKLLGYVFVLLFYYYNRNSPYIDRYTFNYKFTLDLESIYNVSRFFEDKFIKRKDCYLVEIASDIREGLVFPMPYYLHNSTATFDTFAANSLWLFNRGDLIKIKYFSDDQYSYFSYSPSSLISTLRFHKVDNKITNTVDNRMWTDSAWNL